MTLPLAFEQMTTIFKLIFSNYDYKLETVFDCGGVIGGGDRASGLVYYSPVLFLFRSGCLLSVEVIPGPGLFPTAILPSGVELPRGVAPPTPRRLPPSWG